MKVRVERDLKDESAWQRAQMCLDWVWNAEHLSRPRKTVKRNVMTYSYSSKAYGMAEQHREDLMDPLSLKVLQGKLEEHPFGHDKGLAASKYLAAHAYAAIEEVVQLPAEAMDFLQKLARALAHEGKPLRWITPVGVPLINSYYKKRSKQVKLWLHDRGVRVPYTTKLAVGDLPEVNKSKAANAVSPNFVHACDAAHLLRTVNAAVAEGITSIATVHDSFGCLASRAARFRKLIREEFVRMYQEHDVLAEVFEQAKADLSDPNDKRVPTNPPAKGPLKIEETLKAEFAFA